MTDYTHYWTRDTIKSQETKPDPYEELIHTASAEFRLRGVGPGDTVYVINLNEGRLRVIARMVVDLVVDQRGAERILRTRNLWDAADHCIARDGTATPARYDAYLTDSQLAKFRFVTADGKSQGPKHRKDGKIEPQSFRSPVREITPQTAALLDSVLGSRPKSPAAKSVVSNPREVERAVEGLVTESRSKRRNPALRATALRRSNGTCAACGVDFNSVLGGRGLRCLVVHHTKQLKDRDTPAETNINDLAVVCANCHMLIHENPNQAMSVRELRRLLSASGT
jgi:predicted HNH restriction endonuclease